MNTKNVSCMVRERSGSDARKGSARFEIVFSPPDFDPDTNPDLTLAVLEQTAEILDGELSSTQPHTDKYLRYCSDKVNLVRGWIDQIRATNASHSITRTYPRKEKRIEKAMRRKAARADRLRK
jgi:hypothetical protein